MQTIEKIVGSPAVTGSSGWPLQGAWTYADYLRLPEDDKRYEIIEGVLYVANAPTPEHQFTVTELLFHLRQHVSTHNLGIVLPAPVEVHLAETTRPVQPISFLCLKNANRPAVFVLSKAHQGW